MPAIQTYQPDLIRQGVIASLGAESIEGRKLNSCRYKSGCNSILCPCCLHRTGYKQGQQLLRSSDRLPASRLKFASFLTADVPVTGLRDAAQAIMRAGRAAMKALRIEDYALRQETSLVDWSTDYHPHAHALVDTPAKGRGYISTAAWEDTWLSQLPSWLHPNGNAVHVDHVREVGATTTYLTKSAFAGQNEETSRATISRVIDGLLGTKNLRRFELRGALAA